MFAILLAQIALLAGPAVASPADGPAETAVATVRPSVVVQRVWAPGDGGAHATCNPQEPVSLDLSDQPREGMREVQESTIVCYALCDEQADSDARYDAYQAWLSCRRGGGSHSRCNRVYAHAYWNAYREYFNGCMLDCTTGPYD